MKIIRFLLRFAISLIVAVILVIIGLYATGNSHLIKAVRSTYLEGKTGPTIDDYSKFENRIVNTAKVQRWQKANNYNNYFLDDKLEKGTESFETTALIVIKDKKIVFEKYFENYSETSQSNSFSMAKSFTSLCIGAAIKEGKIKSVNQRVGDFLTEFKDSDLKISELLTMTSGIDFGESYGDPFGFMSKTYYGEDLYELTLSKKLQEEPGTQWKYQGGNTLLLSFIIKKATGKNLAEYFSEKFWKPIGAKKNALWTLNKENGIEKAYCCFYSNARDYARIGQLMLDSGNWNGTQLITREYFDQSIAPVKIPDENNQIIDYYGYQWWLGSYQGVEFSYARGIQGQYIVSIPQWNTVLVRLGHKRDPARGVIVPKDLYIYLEVARLAVNKN